MLKVMGYQSLVMRGDSSETAAKYRRIYREVNRSFLRSVKEALVLVLEFVLERR